VLVLNGLCSMKSVTKNVHIRPYNCPIAITKLKVSVYVSASKHNDYSSMTHFA